MGSRGPDSEEGAEIIDLVHLPRGTRPTPIAYLDYEEVSRCRNLECNKYTECLEFAARVRWKSFHCRQCVFNEETEESLDRVHEPAAVILLR